MGFRGQQVLRWFAIVLCFVLTDAFRTTVAAQEPDDARWLSRVLVGKVLTGSTEGQVTTGDGLNGTVTATDGVAVLFDLSRRVGQSFLIQGGFGYWTFPSRISVTPMGQPAEGDVERKLSGFRSGELHLGVVYGHSLVGPVSFYGGPLIVASSRDVAEIDEKKPTVRVALASTLGPGFQAGILIGRCFSPRVSIDVNVRRSLLEASLNGGGQYNLNPWLFSVGISIQH
jgi:hypothetical protein